MASLHQRNIGPMQCARRCGARTRAGTPCAAPSIAGAVRCRMHGGKGSGAPSGNRNAVKTGLHTARMRAEAKQVRQIVRRATALIELVEGMRSAGLAAATESNLAPKAARRARSTSCPAPQLKVELTVSYPLISWPRKPPTTSRGPRWTAADLLIEACCFPLPKEEGHDASIVSEEPS
jgi:hypothetical protein